MPKTVDSSSQLWIMHYFFLLTPLSFESLSVNIKTISFEKKNYILMLLINLYSHSKIHLHSSFKNLKKRTKALVEKEKKRKSRRASHYVVHASLSLSLAAARAVINRAMHDEREEIDPVILSRERLTKKFPRARAHFQLRLISMRKRAIRIICARERERERRRGY